MLGSSCHHTFPEFGGVTEASSGHCLGQVFLTFDPGRIAAMRGVGWGVGVAGGCSFFLFFFLEFSEIWFRIYQKKKKKGLSLLFFLNPLSGHF